MIRHQIYAVAALVLAVALTVAVADTRLDSGQIATSLAAVSGDCQARPDGRARCGRPCWTISAIIRARFRPAPLTFPQLANLAQFTVEIDFDFNSAAIRPESYRNVGAIADALHNPILLGYGFLVIGHTDSVGGRAYNVGLSQRRAEAIVAALVDPFGVNPAVLQPVGMGEEQLRDPAHPTSGVNRRVQLINVGKKFCFGRSGEQFVCQ